MFAVWLVWWIEMCSRNSILGNSSKFHTYIEYEHSSSIHIYPHISIYLYTFMSYKSIISFQLLSLTRHLSSQRNYTLRTAALRSVRNSPYD